MAFIEFKILFFVQILMIVSTDTDEDIPYWTEMRRLLKYQSVDTRIIGGQLASKDQAPWMVSLINVFHFEQYCGGVIIGERSVMTAAHCTVAKRSKDNQTLSYYRPDQILVKYDGLNKHELKQINVVTKIIRHPKWGHFTNLTEEYAVRGDIAILHLHYPVIESDTVRIIPISDETPPPGSEATLTGWGRTRIRENITKDDYPVMLQTARLKIISKSQCNRIMIEKHLRQKIQVPRLFICANNPTATACDADSGSPLAMDGKLIGILSHGIEGCPLNGTTAFSNPVTVRTWINNNIL